MNRFQIVILGVLLLFSAPLQAQTLRAPAGWTQNVAGGVTTWSQNQSRLVLGAPQTFSGDIAVFLQKQIARDLPSRGTLLQKGAVSRDETNNVSVPYTFQNQSVVYAAFAQGAQKRFLMFSAPDAMTLLNQSNVLFELARQIDAAAKTAPAKNAPAKNPAPRRAAIAKQPANTSTPRVTKPRRNQAKKSPGGARKSVSPIATPRARLSASKIVGVYLVENWDIGVGGAMILVYDPVLLLRDGSAFDSLEIPPTDFDVAASKRAQPRDWGRWTRTKDGFRVVWNRPKDTDEIKNENRCVPAKPGERLNRAYSSTSGGGNTAMGGDVMIAISGTYEFFPDGRFSTERSAGGTSSSITTLSKSKNAGTYRLDGHALTLRFNDGKTLRRLFYFYPSEKSRSDVIGIGSSTYIGEKRR